MPTPAAPWTCPSCHDTVATPYCPRCGEEPIPPEDLTFRGVAARIGHALTTIDARAARSARRLLGSPGALTVEWIRGVRKPYVAPFQLFLLANVIFFAVQSLSGANVFSSTLASHLHQQDWSELAQALVARRVEALHTTREAYAPIFDRAVVLHAKSLIVLMTVPFALLLPLVFARSHRPFMAHLVFSVHLFTFLLVLFTLALAVGLASGWLGLGHLDSPVADTVLSTVLILLCAGYLYLAIGPAYGARGPWRAVQAAVLALMVGALVLGYRFVLFLITLYTT